MSQDKPAGIVKETERGSPTTLPAAVVGNPEAGRVPKAPPEGEDSGEAKSDEGAHAPAKPGGGRAKG